MWRYAAITREEFEKKKDEIETIIVSLGGKRQDILVPYENITTSIFNGRQIVNQSQRSVYEFQGEYFRVDEVCFKKPFIVIECGTHEDLIYNRMEDAEPFPYDLPYEELVNEVKYAMGILPYPDRQV